MKVVNILNRDSKGRATRVYSVIEVKCKCGKHFTTTTNRTELGRGKYCSKPCAYKYRKVVAGTEHHSWKGELVGYSALHNWVYRNLGSPNKCEHCGTSKAKRFEWANISGAYKRELTDWKRLCTKCHHKLDNISSRGWATRKVAV